MPKSNEEFQIGLSMSGAISAGAYTAGVFDFLIQALDEWERARGGAYREEGVDPDNVPNHRVGIKVMSGASAGAITAAIGAVALADANQVPVKFSPPRPAGSQTIKYYLPKLYETWVVKPSLVAAPGETTDFLTNDDLGGPPRPAEIDFTATKDVPSGDPELVTSALNSRLLDEIAEAAISVTNVTATPRAYIAKNLHVYLTLSNLRGVPYKISFSGADDYHMIAHGDRVHYAVAGLGNWDSASPFADQDKPRPIAASELVGGPEGRRKWQDFSICALGSAAFPVGLAPRRIGATLEGPDNEYDGRSFPIDALAGKKILTDFTSTVRGERLTYWFTTADGGIIDNDPFEYARFSIKEKLTEPSEPSPEESHSPALNERDAKKADRAVIMISPFPELKPIKPQGEPKSGLLSIFLALMPALIDQARFKPGELVLAADPGVASRYLIGPSRLMDVTDPKSDARYPIASGLLGGFGGFVAEVFRDYDYQLGRRNCQWFLRQTFTVPKEHNISIGWRDLARTTSAIGAEPTELPESYSIIPLFGTAAQEVVQPEWPRISQSYLEDLQKRIAARLDYIAAPLLEQNVQDMLLRSLLKGAWKLSAREKALTYVNRTLLADLARRDQIEGWDLTAGVPGLKDDDVREVLAALIDPASNRYSAKDLAKATGLDEATVVMPTLNFCLDAAKDKKYRVWKTPWKKDGEETYALVALTTWADWLKGQAALAAQRIGA